MGREGATMSSRRGYWDDGVIMGGSNDSYLQVGTERGQVAWTWLLVVLGMVGARVRVARG